MSFLNQTQIAALQQMGICVWQRSNNFDLPAQAAKTENQPVMSDSANAQMNPVKRTGADKAVSQAHVTQLRESLNAMPDGQNQRQPELLTEQQQADHAPFIADLILAWESCHKDNSQPAIYIGSTLSVSSGTIVLPVLPDVLTAQQKATLWKQLWQ